MREDKLLEALGGIRLELEQARSDLATGLTQFHDAMPLLGARPVQVGATGANTLAWAGLGRLLGWSLRATGGALTVMIRDSRQPSVGDFLGVPELAAETSSTAWFGPTGISFGEGVYVQAEQAVPGAGVLQGVIYLGAHD